MADYGDPLPTPRTQAVADHANREEEIRNNFYHYDANGSGTIERSELAQLLSDLGFDSRVIDSKFAEW